MSVTKSAMEPERWREIEQLYHAARECPPGERNQFLKKACQDERVRSEVEALLECEEQAESFLEAPALEVTAAALAEGRSRSMLGRVLGHYEIAAFVGAGGMGEVYRARDSRIGRDVAIKVLPPGVAATHPERLRLFEQEARAAGAINHPNILSIFDVGIQDGAPYVVYELLEGETLRDRLGKGALSRRKALECGRQIATGLAAAHDKGIAHRDLKPENLFLTRDGRVKILDFGLAKLTLPGEFAGREMNGAAPSPHPGSGHILGTPGYLAPEQLRGDVVDHRADIFNLGAILYEMLAGQRLFRGVSTSEVLNAIRKDEPIEVPQPGGKTDGMFDPSVARLLRRCLEKNPRQRIQSALDVAFDLEDLLEPYETVSPPRSRLGLGVAAALLAIVAAALAFLHFREAPPAAAETRTEINTLPTSDPASFALSPDGRLMVFAASGDGPQRLWLRRLDSTTAQPLPGTEGASAPFWSPDNRSVAFFAAGKLKRLNLGGGLPRTLADAPWTGGAWGPNGSMEGTILYASAAGPLLRMPASGGESVAATRPLEKAVIHRNPQFLPGGRQFIFYAPGPVGIAAMYLGSLDSAETKRLTSAEAAGAYAPSGWFLFTRTGVLLAQRLDLARGQLSGDPIPVADAVAQGGINYASAFSVSDAGPIAYRSSSSGRRQLLWFDRSGKALDNLGAPDANLSGPRLSPDGRRVAVWRVAQDNHDIWLLDGPRLSRFTFDPGFDRWPVWSPDGGNIVFDSDRKGVFNLYIKPSNNAANEQLLLESAYSKFASDWSRDGRFILYHSFGPQTSRDIWVLPLGGDRKPFVFLKTSFSEAYGTFSPDGRWVAYLSDQSGRNEVYVRPFAKTAADPSTGGAGAEWQVSTSGGAYPRWRSDGKELYYIAPDGKLMAAPITINGETLEPGAPVPLFQTRILGGGADAPGLQYDVSRDGRFLINTILDEAAPITLIQNWSPPAK
jgi:serine/threonine protein kinase/Tol biopolymer transport system component